MDMEWLDGARAVRYDPHKGVVLVWRGGHTVNVYSESGTPLDALSVGDFRVNDADESEVWEAMDDYITGRGWD
jgi:hypothetical protein